MAVKGTFVAQTPIIVMMLVIFLVGLVRSMYFTGQNALAFAEIGGDQAGPATAIHSVVRPIATALAVAMAGAILEGSAHLRGEPLGVLDFHIAFWVIGAVSALAAIPYLRMKKDAGSDVSGHRTAAQRALIEEAAEAGYDVRTTRP